MASTKYKVFISFRGVDTRYSFVSHLSDAFRRQGNIELVTDNNRQDDELSEETREAVRESRVSVVVLSDNYAFCKPCLDTLVEALERRRNKGQVVVPVFYGVTRTKVEKQAGTFAEAFSRHERTESALRVAKWRDALSETARLKEGHESSVDRSDLELVEEIVANVHEKLFPTDKIGINWRLLELENLLCKQPWIVRRLGIWGMGGIGKTTLAEAAFNLMRHDYETSFFIKAFYKTFREMGLYHLREQRLSKLQKKELDNDIKCSTANRSHTGNKLRIQRVLVVLDDVRNPINAESFLGGFEWFGPGSLIIITSRDKQVLVQCGVNQIYNVTGLNEDEALQLFSRCAFGKDVTEEDLLEVSKKVIAYADGNPEALSFYGRKLKDLKPTEMEEQFLKLKTSPPHQIMDVFKSSYDALSKNEKNIFLDIACFFRGEDVNYVIQLLEGCGFFPRVGIDVLVEKSLVIILENKVQMHNLIQEVGREIINGETEQIERRRRLWDPSSIEYLLKYDELEANGEPKGTEDIEGIFLDATNLSFAINPKAFENMYNLRLLKIYSSDPGNLPGLHLPKGLASLPYELRLLHWENYPLRSLPQDFDPECLVELNMPHSQLQTLWGGINNLKMLKTIRLCHSKQLLRIDELSGACNIQIIDLHGCTRLQSLPSMGHLKHLRVLNLSGCTGIKTAPELPSNIEELNLEGTGIREKYQEIDVSQADGNLEASLRSNKGNKSMLS